MNEPRSEHLWHKDETTGLNLLVNQDMAQCTICGEPHERRIVGSGVCVAELQKIRDEESAYVREQGGILQGELGVLILFFGPLISGLICFLSVILFYFSSPPSDEVFILGLAISSIVTFALFTLINRKRMTESTILKGTFWKEYPDKATYLKKLHPL